MCFETDNKQNAEIILKNLKDTPIDHHIRAMTDSLSLCMKSEVTCLGEYLDKRFYGLDNKKKKIKFKDEG